MKARYHLWMAKSALALGKPLNFMFMALLDLKIKLNGNADYHLRRASE